MDEAVEKAKAAADAVLSALGCQPWEWREWRYTYTSPIIGQITTARNNRREFGATVDTRGNTTYWEVTADFDEGGYEREIVIAAGDVPT